jgi:hypothetical protein
MAYVRPAYTRHTQTFIKQAAGSGYRTKTLQPTVIYSLDQESFLRS